MLPMRVLPGKKMPGRMGGEQVTVQNLEIIDVDLEKLPEDKKLLVSEKKFNPSDLKGIKKELEKLENSI